MYRNSFATNRPPDMIEFNEAYDKPGQDQSQPGSNRAQLHGM